ncbi:MAG: flagellar biosynthesis protein FlgJ [Legionellaceae bacterium]|nr:flagellar biosynthesis protein FlgJ [Legionellaceae bacterium]
MDVSEVTITLHPLAKDALFKDYRTLNYIFSNVLGQVETDYLSIALIDKNGRLFFLSSDPSIEYNLIEKELWQFDGCFQPEFVYQDEMRNWFDLYHPDYAESLYSYKQADQGFETGFSIPLDFDEYRAVFSFGFKSANPFFQQQIPTKQEKLVAMGKYCLREIMQAIALPNRQKPHRFKPHLELIINNQANYENPITER